MTAKSSSFPSRRQFESELTRETKRRSSQSSIYQSSLVEAVSGYVWTIAAVGAATAVLYVLRRFLSAGDESFLFLPVVMGSALRYGFGPACVGAFFSFCCWDYFFDIPYFALTISNAHDCISLIIYLIVAVTIARLASRAKKRAREAEARERETATLYQASSALSCEVDTDRLLSRLAEQIVSLCRSSECIVYLWNPSSENLEIAAQSSVDDEQHPHERTLKLAMSAYHDDKIVRLKVSSMSTDLFVPLDVYGKTFGTLYVGASDDGIERSLQEERMIMTLANHAAVVIARQQTVEEGREQARQTAVLDERNRLAREVHDTLSHAFTGIKFLLEAASRIGSPEQTQHCIVQARNLAIEGAQEARRSVLALRPAAIEEANTLGEAIRSLVERQSLDGAVEVEIKIGGQEQRLSASVEDNLLRIAQEAVTNVLKHARAQQITVTLRYTDSELELTVLDDGVGFDSEAVHEGFGMTSMRERAAIIGGRLRVDRADPSGTVVAVSVPLTIDRAD